MRQDGYLQVNLTVEGHACQHDILYRVFNDYRDKLARDGLIGILKKEDIVAELTKKSKRFSGKNHSEESKEKIGKSHRDLWEQNYLYRERKIEHMRNLGKQNHKRNPSVATAKMSGPNKRQYMRQHWRKEVWDAVKEKWENRVSYHWGKNHIASQFDVSVKTIENMLELIQQEIDWDTATNWVVKK
jgi:hypothetical protein